MVSSMTRLTVVVTVSALAVCPADAFQIASPQPPANAAATTRPVAPALPPGYVIGADDVLAIVFWRDADMSAEVVVRPDGKISLPLLKDIDAAGQTPEQLVAALEKAASKYLAEPNATVIVKEIRSRRVFIVGEVVRPGTIPLSGEMNVLQVIAAAGGLTEYAKKSSIAVVRKENGRERRFKFNYNEVIKGKKPQQNIVLRPGDTVVVR